MVAVSPTQATLEGVLPARLASSTVARLTALAALGGTLLLEVQAMLNGYGLRVTSDTPTYLALLRVIARHPLAPVSPFLPVSGLQTSHASPDMEALALIWRFISPSRSLIAPVAAYHLLALWGIVVTLLVAHALFVWVRGLAGSAAAWASIPVLLGLFGPANVVWAGDLSFHGFLYGSYFSQTFAVALLLYALHLVPRASSLWAQSGLAGLVTLLLLVHPFSGVLFVALATTQAVAWAWQGRPGWRRVPATIVVAFLAGSAWPAYSLSAAMVVSGLSGTEIVMLAALAPLLASAAGRMARTLPSPARRLAAPRLPRPQAAVVLALVGLGVVCLVADWEEWLATRPITNPLLPTNHLAIYWDDRLIRWPLLFGAGYVGIVGLARLARLARETGWLPLFWFCSCFAIGLAGSIGAPIPLWNRLLLFCQLPLAAGTAVVLTRTRVSLRTIIVAGFVLSAFARLHFLYQTPPAVSYYAATWLPGGYSLGQDIPPGRGVVAADPYASYYVPGATGHPTLLMSKSHVGSDAELAAAARGYDLLHDLYVGHDWKAAARTMWRRGVRYVIVDHRVILADTSLAAFSSDPEPVWRNAAQRRQLGDYFARLNLLGDVVGNTPEYVVYRLTAAKLRWEVGT